MTIIGIVAAMTVPTLLNKYQNHVWEVAAKDSYSTLSNQLKHVLARNSCTDFGCMGAGSNVYGYNGVNQFIDDLILYNFPNASKVNNVNQIDVKLFDGSTVKLDRITYGAIFMYYKINHNRIFGCWDITFGGGDCSYSNGVCSECIFTTEPGTKNLQYGRNLFKVKLMGDGSLRPYTVYNEQNKKFCNPPQNSIPSSAEDSCLSRLILNGWKMDY